MTPRHSPSPPSGTLEATLADSPPPSRPARWYRRREIVIPLGIVATLLGCAVLWWGMGEAVEYSWQSYIAEVKKEGRPVSRPDYWTMLRKEEFWYDPDGNVVTDSSVQLSKYGAKVASLNFESGRLPIPAKDVETSDLSISNERLWRRLCQCLDSSDVRGSVNFREFFQNTDRESPLGTIVGKLVTRDPNIPLALPLADEFAWTPEMIRGSQALRTAWLWKELLWLDLSFPSRDSRQRDNHFMALTTFALWQLSQNRPDDAVDAWVESQAALGWLSVKSRETEQEDYLEDSIEHNVLGMFIRSGLLKEQHYLRMLKARRLMMLDFVNMVKRSYEGDFIDDVLYTAKYWEDEDTEHDGNFMSFINCDCGYIHPGRGFQPPLRRLTQRYILPWLPRKARKLLLLNAARDWDRCMAHINKAYDTDSHWSLPPQILADAYDPRYALALQVNYAIMLQNLKVASLAYGLYLARHNGDRPQKLDDFMDAERKSEMLEMEGFTLKFERGDHFDLLEYEMPPGSRNLGQYWLVKTLIYLYTANDTAYTPPAP